MCGSAEERGQGLGGGGAGERLEGCAEADEDGGAGEG